MHARQQRKAHPANSAWLRLLRRRGEKRTAAVRAFICSGIVFRPGSVSLVYLCERVEGVLHTLHRKPLCLSASLQGAGGCFVGL